MMKLIEYPVARTLAICFLFVLAGCEKKTEPALAKATPAPAHPVSIEVCRLITNDEITAVQGVPVKESKSSALTQGQFVVTQCFYETSDFSKSVNLALVSKAAGGADPVAYWRKQFSSTGEDKSIAAATTAPAGADRSRARRRRTGPTSAAM